MQRLPLRPVVLGLALLLCFGTAATAQLKNENLLVGLPQGFKVGFSEQRNGMNMQEWVPSNETVQNWTEMVTVQVFLNRTDLDPVKFLTTLQQQWAGACKGSNATSVATSRVNGYLSASMLLRCPLLTSTGKPETTMVKTIKGNDSFYVVQRAVRAIPTSAQLEQTKKYLDGVSLCDTRLPAHPCRM
ncbi:MAG: hypothetical protein J0H97_15695 [Alphaproteobacteria bacterium]|nr:hypothetical protein [Alphaproteobacteria bacterium]